MHTVHYLGMRRVLGKLAHQPPTQNETGQQATVCYGLLQHAKHDTTCIITGDETLFMAMNLKQNKCHNGRCQCHLSKRKQEKCGEKSRQC
jgi:hypothetical protein